MASRKRILILSKNDDGSFTRWAETNNEQGLYNLVCYFASSCYCEDFIIYYEGANIAITFPLYCDNAGIPIKYKKKGD